MIIFWSNYIHTVKRHHQALLNSTHTADHMHGNHILRQAVDQIWFYLYIKLLRFAVHREEKKNFCQNKKLVNGVTFCVIKISLFSKSHMIPQSNSWMLI